jgi:transcription elongation factor GreA
MTAAGYAALEAELRHRMSVERVRLGERVQQATADDANLIENSEYQAAMADREFSESRIATLQDRLARAEVIDISKLSGKTVKFGATVTLIDEESGHKKAFQIVGEPEADAARGKISVMSPIARAIGKVKGVSVEVVVPRGIKFYKIDRVQWTGSLGGRHRLTEARDNQRHLPGV